MQAKPGFVIIVFLTGCALLGDTVEACDANGILLCNQMLGTSAQMLTEGVLPDTITLTWTCSVLDNYTTCVDEKLTGCDSQVILAINIVKDVVNFMCRDSYQAILDNSDCWTDPAFTIDINGCMRKHNQTVKHATGQVRTMGTTWLFRQLCEAMHGVTDCMSSAGQNRCGMETALIMHNMMNAAFRETYKLIRGCSAPTRTSPPISDSMTTTYSYAVYVTSIVACIIVLAVR